MDFVGENPTKKSGGTLIFHGLLFVYYCNMNGLGPIQVHGGYRKLLTFRLSEVIYDVTVRFCDMFLEPRSRTHDQMVQAARSGRQNIAEGSMDRATSSRSEMKLTGVARGSLEELKLDYEDYLRQRKLTQWGPDHPALIRFKALRCHRTSDFRGWVASEAKCKADIPVVVANGALSLLNLCIYLLGRQLHAQADQFLNSGGFTERLYKTRRTRTNTDRH